MNDRARTRVVILGGGFGGIACYRHLAHHFADDEIEITIVNKTNHFLFTPLLHEVATGSIVPTQLGEAIRTIAPRAILYEDEVARISLASRVVHTRRHDISYDYLIIALGSTTHMFGVSGAREHSFTLKSLKEARALKNRCIDEFEEAAHEHDIQERQRHLSFAIVGGGPTGVELAAELHEFLHDTLAAVYPQALERDIAIHVLQSVDELVPNFPPVFRVAALRILTKKGIRVHFNACVARVTHDGVTLESGECVPAHTVVWTAGVKPVVPDFDLPIECDERGRMVVDHLLQLKGYANIFAIGDGSSYGRPPLPALAQVAVDEARMVSDLIVADIKGLCKRRPVYTYTSKGTLMSLGKWNAVAQIGDITLKGPIAWWLWRTVYLFKMHSWRKRIEVAIDWTLNSFARRDITQV